MSVEYVLIAGKAVAIPGHLTSDQRERFHRGHPDYVAPTAAECPPKVQKRGAEAIETWVAARSRLEPLTKDELDPPPPDEPPAPAEEEE